MPSTGCKNRYQRPSVTGAEGTFSSSVNCCMVLRLYIAHEISRHKCNCVVSRCWMSCVITTIFCQIDKKPMWSKVYDTSIASRREKPIFVLFILLINVVLPSLESTPLVPNYRLFDFFNRSLTTLLIQKFVQDITSFVVACFISTSSLRMT